ncbi:MAG: hypothetical protein WD398_10805 [Cyclobacteriaceae bacterium]
MLIDGDRVVSENTGQASFKRKLSPVLFGDWWLIGPPPSQGRNNIPVKMGKDGKFMKYESVDHHIFQAEDGNWHLWGCVRHTGWGRILYKNLTDSPWEATGEFIRANAAFGESINGWYYTGMEDGDPKKGGMFVRTSRDLLHWSNYQLVHRAQMAASSTLNMGLPIQNFPPMVNFFITIPMERPGSIRSIWKVWYWKRHFSLKGKAPMEWADI